MRGCELRCSVAAIALVFAAGGAEAQTSVDSQIQTLQQQIQQLQQQIQQLQNQVNAQKAPPPAAPAAAVVPPPGGSPFVNAGVKPAIPVQQGNDLGIESADGNYSIYLTGRLHFDAGAYLDEHNSDKGLSNSLTDGVNARRARLGVTGKFLGDWTYAFIYDFGGTNDNGPSFAGAPAVASNSTGIENAYVSYWGLQGAAFPVVFDLGYMDTFYSLDEATSSNNIMFLERSSSQVVATEFGAGDFRSQVGARSFSDRYWAGVYLTGPTSGENHAVGTGGESYATYARFTYQLLQGDNYSLHVGADVLATLRAANDSLTLSDRPELRIDTTSLLSTGALNAIKDANVVGGEAAGGYGSFFAQGEYFHYTVDRNLIAQNTFDGEYLEASYTLTGEHRKYDVPSGAYTGITPDHPFSLSAGTWGAFEVGARFSEVNLNDAVGAKNAVIGGRQDVWTFGLNWYFNPYLRMMFDYQHGDLYRPIASATVGNRVNFDAVSTRMQVAF